MRRRIPTTVAAVAAAALLLPAVGLADPGDDGTGAATTDTAAVTPLAGKTVFLDPGHQGTDHSEDLSRQVDDGRGGTKDCQTTGMTSLGGVPEHTITWDVAQLVRAGLEKLGATVELSRQDDTGWGGCVDERARAANASGADLAISIHADSTATGEDDANHGFHLIVPTLPIPDQRADEVQSGEGLVASKAIRDAYVNGGFTPANYAGVTDGIQTRNDIAGPALTTVPLAFVEMGNGSNPGDAAVLESQEGRLKHAVAIIVGSVDYLMGVSGTTAEVVTAPSPTTTTTATPTTTTVAPAPAARAEVATTTTTQTTTTTPTTTTTAAGDEASLSSDTSLGQGLAALQSLLAAFGLDGLEEFATADNLGIFAQLLTALLDTLD